VLDNPERDLPFWTLVANRCSYNGKLQGWIPKDVSYNWNGKAHAEALRRIRQLSKQIEFLEGDGIKLLRDYANDPSASSFIDPPYVKAGKSLYKEWRVDPSEVFDALAGWQGFWLMTYDNVPEIKRLVEKHGFLYREMPMRTNKGQVKKELLMRSRYLPYSPKEWPRWKQPAAKNT
jgi:DNA adenine methylase